MLKRLLMALGLLIPVLLPSPALADLILPGGCRFGACWDTNFLSKEPIRDGTNGDLYAVEIATREWLVDTESPGQFDESFTVYVYCSTTRPAYIASEEGTYFANLLNPGGGFYGFNASDYPIYWATCHNLVGPDFFSEEMTARAIQLGYPLDLPSEQIELDNPLDIME